VMVKTVVCNLPMSATPRRPMPITFTRRSCHIEASANPAR
jgi:hypothetical protein